MKTTSLELSKRLKELGVKIETEHVWVVEKKKQWVDYVRVWEMEIKDFGYGNDNGEDEAFIFYPAPIAEELGEFLPSWLLIEGEIWLLRIIKNPDEWGIYYENDKHAGYIGTEGGGSILNESLTNSMAEMLIYLKEQNLI